MLSMGDYSFLSQLSLYCLLMSNYGYGQYANNIPAVPFPYQTTLGLYPYQSYHPYPIISPTHPYPTIPWMHYFLPNTLPNQQAINGTDWTNYPVNIPAHRDSYPGGWGRITAPRDGVKPEILDYYPDYYRILLGLNAPDNQVSTSARKPDFKVQASSQNATNIPTETKSIVFQKTFTTTIRRSFIIEPSKSAKVEPVHKQYEKDVELTTILPDTTTENQNATGKNFTQKPRRFIDVPKSCSDGYGLDHKGNCIVPFFVS